MSLRLDVAERRMLRGAERALLSPLSAGDVHAWGLRVTERLRSLTGCDKAGMIVPRAGGMDFISGDYEPVVPQLYAELTRPLQQRTRFIDRGVRLGAWNRPRLWGRHLDYYHTSAYYHEYIVPHRMFDAVGLACATRREPSIDSVAQILLHSHAPRGAEYEQRTLLMLRRLLPAFRSAIRTGLRLHALREDLAALIDSVTDALLVCRPDGRVLHRNAAAAALLDADPDAARVMAAAHELAVTGAPTAALRTRTGAWHLHLTEAGAGLLDAGAARIIRIGRAAPGWHDVAGIQRRFGLTPRQAQVAVRLPHHQSNAEIAADLGISVHTVKRHVEQVLLRLGVASRRDVARRLAD